MRLRPHADRTPVAESCPLVVRVRETIREGHDTPAIRAMGDLENCVTDLVNYFLNAAENEDYTVKVPEPRERNDTRVGRLICEAEYKI